MPRDDESFRNWIAKHIRETQTALAEHGAALKAGDIRMCSIESRVSSVEEGLKLNTEATLKNAKTTDEIDRRTKEIAENTAKIVDVWSNLEAGFKFINWTGQAAEWFVKKIVAISAVAAACYFAWLTLVQNIRDGLK